MERGQTSLTQQHLLLTDLLHSTLSKFGHVEASYCIAATVCGLREAIVIRLILHQVELFVEFREQPLIIVIVIALIEC